MTAYVNCPCGNLTIGTNGEQLQAHRLCGGDFSNGGEWQTAFVDPCNFTDLARNICRIAEVLEALKKSSPLVLSFVFYNLNENIINVMRLLQSGRLQDNQKAIRALKIVLINLNQDQYAKGTFIQCISQTERTIIIYSLILMQ